MRSVQVTTTDGVLIDADLAEPAGEARGGVAICHPHPRYGGDRFNAVVDALFTALPPAGFRALRFDFRAGGDGVLERHDLIAALDTLAAGGGPLFVAGYSYGAGIALGTGDARIAALIAIAPPLGRTPAAAPAVPTLLLVPRHDQFCPPDAAAATVAGWPQAELDVVESADHFLAGRADEVARRAVAWLTARCDRHPAT